MYVRFLSIGECMAELTPSEDKDQYALAFGGDTFNTAWYLRRLKPEMKVAYYTALGDDPLSDRLVTEMGRFGIEADDIIRVAGRSIGLYLVNLMNGERSFSYWREASAARHLVSNLTCLEAAITKADTVYFSGVTLAILSPSDRSTLLGALQGARQVGKTIVFDPNLRPQLWSSADEMKSSVMEASIVSDVVLPSFEDEAAYFSDRDMGETLSRYETAGPSSVIVKNGPDPIHYMHDGVRGVVEVEPVSCAVDTTAAGDSFNGALLAYCFAGAPIQECIRAASKVASVVIRHRGALVTAPLEV